MKPPRRSSGSEEPLAKIPKKTHSNREGGDTDHVAEITQLKEKVAGMQRVISSKNNELIVKQGENDSYESQII